MDALETIAHRKSIRSYSDSKLSADELSSLQAAADAVQPLGAAKIRLHVIGDGASIDGEIKGVLGDYGKVIHAPHYLAVTAEESEHYLVDSGYRFEQLLLEATSRGLGTCWVGGFFVEASLRAVLGLAEDQRVVAISPLGRPTGKAGLLERTMRFAVGSKDRKPVSALFFWDKAGEPLPEAVVKDPRCAKLFEAIRRAPSWVNKQPWRFVVRPDEILVYKTIRQLKEGKDYHRVDCGIAMAHLQLAALALGLAGEWRLDAPLVPGAPEAESIARFVFSQRWLPVS